MIYFNSGSAVKLSVGHRVLLPPKWLLATILALLVLGGGARAQSQGEYTTFRFSSAGAREITVPDTATLGEVLEILRSNNIRFNGPREQFVDDGTGRQVLTGHRLTVELTMYDPSAPTDPDCPYKQVTDMWYGQTGRLQQYNVLFFLTCIE